jgi:hypothetical protein
MGMQDSMDEEQLSFLSEMLDEPTEPVTPEETGEAEETVETPAEITDSVEDKEKPQDGEKPTEESDELSLVESLRAQLLSMTEALQADPLVQTVKPDVTSENIDGTAAIVAPQTASTLSAFLSEEELDRLIDEPQLINVAFQRSQQAMLSSVSTLVQQEVNKQIMVSRAITDFYTENNDLLPYSKFVQFVMNEVETKNRDKTYDVIFKTTADECRKRLGLSTSKDVVRDANKGQQKPAFAGSKKSNSRPVEAKEFFDKNAADIFDLRD